MLTLIEILYSVFWTISRESGNHWWPWPDPDKRDKVPWKQASNFSKNLTLHIIYRIYDLNAKIFYLYRLLAQSDPTLYSIFLRNSTNPNKSEF